MRGLKVIFRDRNRFSRSKDDAIVTIIETGLSNKVFTESCVRLIQKIYEVDRLLFPGSCLKNIEAQCRCLPYKHG